MPMIVTQNEYIVVDFPENFQESPHKSHTCASAFEPGDNIGKCFVDVTFKIP